jgi:ferredoxin--NADP+ reductase
MIGLKHDKPLLRAYQHYQSQLRRPPRVLEHQGRGRAADIATQHIQPGDTIIVGRKYRNAGGGYLLWQAAVPAGHRHGSAPFMSVVRDPSVYDDEQIVPSTAA